MSNTSGTGKVKDESLQPNDYGSWDHQSLVARVTALESRLQDLTTARSQSPPLRVLKQRKSARPFVPSKYSTRHIALKFAYLGQNYNGLEHHDNNVTQLPTIEEELWKALVKTRLIFKEIDEKAWMKGNILLDWEGCEYSKCGRTDKGVSAFGQVVGVRVRSARPVTGAVSKSNVDEEGSAVSNEQIEEPVEETKEWDPIKDEIAYARVLNRVLPEDIRVLAWAETPRMGWSARFDCSERRYRYFFTQPCFPPLSGEPGLTSMPPSEHAERDGWLNIEAMKEAATHYQGSRDFRNFCKVDPDKQIENFTREVTHAGIHELSPADPVALHYVKRADVAPLRSAQEPKVYYFEVRGTGFLWHQVRHLVAVLFLVGQGFESPDIVRDLLNAEKYPGKPFYEMADDAPLVLWDCVFPDRDGPKDVDTLPWIYPEQQIEIREGRKGRGPYTDGRHGPGGLNEVLWSSWRQKKIDEILSRTLLDLVAGHTSESGVPLPPPRDQETSQRVFDGSSRPRLVGQYVPIERRRTMDTPEAQNARAAERKDLKLRALAEKMNSDS